MTNKTRNNLYLDDETMAYIEDYKEETGVSFNGQMVDQICREHQALLGQDRSREYIMRLMAEHFQEMFAEEMKRFRLAANRSDKNTQVLLELMNGFAMDQNLESCITTPIFESQAVKDAKEAVEERISNQRQKKISVEESQATSSR
ncbi:hypothetical protein MUO14_09155 [Halobacillus shinanisalinarum]|uniref:Uncharacterized protein n=1 Tax=Halobacillus shinanisalinarum TaxID=2932258 RepID=A0ABY4H423_9BACI|nr:hypothetical protein [Halobacillus shinanisalinarum]UOQ95074.1 hypothetical protein MUO14_09155 [Halobacillus shinanisalinarum]